jgi:GTP:adenosylcobinamide-phosphate guanylyltransferase
MIAVITAGGRVGGSFAEAIGTEVKALAPIGARTLIDAAIDAARAAGAERISIVGGDAVRTHCGGRVDEIIAEDAEGHENLRRAICAAVDRPLLLMTSDLPFIEGDALGAFVRAARGADVALPLASEAAYAAAYPGAPSHVTSIGRERVVNGSVAFFAPGVGERVLPAAQRLFDARKSLWRMALLLGPRLVTLFALRRLQIEDVEHRAAATLGVRALAIRNASPALCYDVDTLEDYRYAITRSTPG